VFDFSLKNSYILTMGCSGCKKKTYKDYAKKVDKVTGIAVTGAIILIGLAAYGIYSLIIKLL